MMELEPLKGERRELRNGHDKKFDDISDNSDAERPGERDRWGNRCEFLLAIVGFTVGIGSIWRFPIRCAKNGGGAFLIPFFFFMFTCGGPLYYLEVSLGQFSGKAAGASFEFCPLLKGIGFLMVIISFDILWYYVTIMGWIQYYLVYSFYPTLPWSSCDNWWNTDNCRLPDQKGTNTMDIQVNDAITNLTSYNSTFLTNTAAYTNSSLTNVINTTPANVTFSNASTSVASYTSPAMEFWLYNVLRKSEGLEDMGSIHWYMVLSCFVGWGLVVAALIKGVKSLGKVVYVTATAPYFLLTVLLIRGVTLEGAVDGILWYITPDFERLADPQVFIDVQSADAVFGASVTKRLEELSLDRVRLSHSHDDSNLLKVWLDAAIQVFYSLGPTYGGVITMASHNKFHQKSLLETSICVASDAFTAFYAGLVVFACIGFMAHEAGVSVEEAAKSSGPGLAFVAYPEALNRMPLPNMWSVLFFLMLTTVIFDSTFGMYETVTGTIIDLFPRVFRNLQWLVLIGVALLLFLLSIPFCTNGGIYLFQLADWYVSSFALLFGSALEATMVCWIYGADRFARDIELMTGRKTSVLLRFMWCICLTGFLSIAFVITVLTYQEPNYGDGYVYQPYAISIGFIISILPMLPIFVVMVTELYKAQGPLMKRVMTLLRPSQAWQPIDEQAREIYRLRPYRYEDTVCNRIKRDILGDKETPWL